MYTTCIYCQGDLGRNEAVEHFPVGRRLAFDGATGRLWVVCRRCERWNLSPLDIRWEAIEECERAFRDTRLRVSTDNIGLARVREGLELVRIGDPLRPEIAAWRYGDQFGRRRRRTMIIAGAGVATFGAVMAGAAAAGISIGAFSGMWQLPQAIAQNRVRVKVRTSENRVLQVRGRDLAGTRLTDEGGVPILTVPHKQGKPEAFRGDDAIRAAGLIMPALNRAGGNKAAVAAAVDRLEEVGTANAFLESAARELRPTGYSRKARGLARLPVPTRLAIEMALHEEQERRALEGELKVLERAWREAEEIAAIADNMFVGDETTRQLELLRSRRRDD